MKDRSAITLNRRPAPRPLRRDPTRTTTIRLAFIRELRRRFARLKLRVVDLIVREDAFGLDQPPTLIRTPTANTRWRFRTSPDKIAEFQRWLRQQMPDVLGDEQLWQEYVRRGFRQGAGRAFDDVKPRRFGSRQGDFYEGSREQFLRDSFARPESVEKVKLLSGRVYDDLEGVTAEMATRMTRHLTDGLTRGENPREIARALSDDIDGIGRTRAETIAQTEVIRAHADGQLMAFEALGVEELGVSVEWTVTEDEILCPLCEAMAGVVLKLDEARGMIPRHPR